MADLAAGAGLGAVVAEGLTYLIAEAKKVKAFKSLSKDLASAIEKLIPLTEDVDSLVKKQEDLGVDKELEELNETIDGARVVVGKCGNVKWYQCNQKAKYAREIEQINKHILNFCQTYLQLIQQKTLLQIREDISSVPAQPGFSYLCSVPPLGMVAVGLDWPLRELKKKLLDDSVNSVVVSGSPGCGKTTLVTQLCHDEVIKGKFEHIFFNVVSGTPNFGRIVHNLLKHNGRQAPTFDNDHQAVNGLRKLLEELQGKGILLVLDDVWCGAFLDNFPTDIPSCKILVTSRIDFPSFDYTYHLKPLEDKDSKALLIHWAYRPEHTAQDEYEKLLTQILKRCNGFPLVIKVVGASLKKCSLTSWKGQVKSWSEGGTVLENPSPTVLQRLQPSFDALDSNLKHCFSDMGLFLEDQRIRASIIIDIWSELYGISDSIVCMKYLLDLAAQNLLDLVPLGYFKIDVSVYILKVVVWLRNLFICSKNRRKEPDDGFYNDLLVTQHDILRELAICQSKSEEKLERKRLNLEIKEDKFPEWCLDLTQPINARLLSIFTDDAFSSTWVEMDCPNVEALFLNLSSSVYVLPSFIARMKKLKVLTITNHGFFSARLSNLSYLSSLPNLKRIRLEKVSVTWLDITQLQLDSLKKLSLFMCSFGKVLKDTEEINVSNVLSSLQEIDIDYCYDLDELPYWVSEAVSLKTLSVTNCNKLSILPEDIGNLSKLEVLRLCSCINLSELPETTARLSNLQFLDISDCLGLKKLPLEIGKQQKLKKISMRKYSGCELPDSVRNLENLEVKCDEETAYLWKRLKPKMRNLTIDEEETEYNLNMFQMF